MATQESRKNGSACNARSTTSPEMRCAGGPGVVWICTRQRQRRQMCNRNHSQEKQRARTLFGHCKASQLRSVFVFLCCGVELSLFWSVCAPLCPIFSRGPKTQPVAPSFLDRCWRRKCGTPAAQGVPLSELPIENFLTGYNVEERAVWRQGDGGEGQGWGAGGGHGWGENREGGRKECEASRRHQQVPP